MSVMCACERYTGRGCWEHSQREPRLVMAYRLGVDDGTDRQHTDFLRPFATWPQDEQEWYRAGWAFATGRYPQEVAS